MTCVLCHSNSCIIVVSRKLPGQNEPGFLTSMLKALPLSHGVHTLPGLSSSPGPGWKEEEENLIASFGILLILRFLNNLLDRVCCDKKFLSHIS